MPADFLLTTFSPSMFGEKATVHIRLVDTDEAKSLVGPNTVAVASRVSHEQLVKRQLDAATTRTQRFVTMMPGQSGVAIHYRGPAVPDDGTLPAGGAVNFYHIEVEDYQEPG